VKTEQCLFGNQLGMRAGHVNYPNMAYDAALQRYLLTFAGYYYRNVQPSSEKGPMVQGGSELIVLAPHPRGPGHFFCGLHTWQSAPHCSQTPDDLGRRLTNQVRADGIQQVNLSMLKNFEFAEKR